MNGCYIIRNGVDDWRFVVSLLSSSIKHSSILNLGMGKSESLNHTNTVLGTLKNYNQKQTFLKIL